MHLRPRILVGPILVLVYFGLFQGGLYFLKNRVQEIALLAVLGLWAYGLLQFASRRDGRPWHGWTFGPLAMFLGLLTLPAIAFHLHTGGGVVPSMLAGRHFGFLLLAPALFFLHRVGFSTREQERWFVVALVVLVLNYLVHYLRIDLQAAYLSGDHLMANMVTFDPWRGFRLKAPYYVLLVLILYGGLRILQPGPWWMKAGLAVAVGLSAWIFSIVMTRAALLAVLVAVASYPLFFRKPAGVLLFVAALPLGLLVVGGLAAGLVDPVRETLAHDWSFQVRLKSWGIAWKEFLAHPLLGFGQASYFSLSYQDLFGRQFYPTDLGIVGVAFKYGVAGVGLYLGILGWTIVRLVRAHWIVRRRDGRSHPLLWALLVLMLSLVVNAGLQPALTMAAGLGMCAFAFAHTGMVFADERAAAGSATRNETPGSAILSD